MGSSSIKNNLLYEIKSGRFEHESRLPPEAELAKSFGVSRTSLRDALADLENEGFILRRHGIGTIINKHVVSVATRIDLEVEFLDMIREAGAEPSLEIVDISTVQCTEDMAGKLDTIANTPVLSVARKISGDGMPVIYCTDYISFQVIKDYAYTDKDLSEPIFYFLSKFCDVDVSMDLSVIEPVLADEYLAGQLQVKVGAPLMMIDEIGYDVSGRRVLYSEEYYANRLLRHTVMRKKI